MKRFFLTLALIAVVLGVMLHFAPQPFGKGIAIFPPNSTVSVYCRETNLEATDMGNGFLVECGVDELAGVLSQCGGVDGISVKFHGTAEDFSLLQQRLFLKVTSRQQFEGLTVLCGKSEKIRGGIFLDGNFVNLQMAFDGETITVGSPLILDSY